MPLGTVVVSQPASQPTIVGVAVAITASLRVPPVSSYWTLVTPGEAPASSHCPPDTVAPFDGSATEVTSAGGC